MTKIFKENIAEENGKFYIRMKIGNIQRQRLAHGATSRKQAKAILDAELYKLRQEKAGIIKKEEKIKFQKLYSLYKNYSFINKQRSYSRDLSILKILKQYFSENSYCNDYKYSDFEKFKINIEKDRGCKRSTINKYLSTLSKMYNLGINEGLISDNPLRKVKKYTEKNNGVRFLKADEEKRMFKVINEKYPHIKAIVQMALYTGMRRGEIFNLKWENVDLENGIIELLETKTDKSRQIPISDRLKNILMKLDRTSEFVFTNPNTNMPYTDIKHSFGSALKEANIENFRFHDLRHTAATRLVSNGVDLVTVKELLGHSKIETTMRYAHSMPDAKIQAMNKLCNFTNR